MIDGGLRGILRKHMPHVHWQAVETGGTGLGIPDDNGCLRGVETWLELKQTDAWAVKIRPEQVAWSERRIRAGGRVYLLTRRHCLPGPRRARADELWVHHGSDTRHVLTHGLRDGPRPILRFDGGPAQWVWPMLEELLFGPPLLVAEPASPRADTVSGASSAARPADAPHSGRAARAS